VEGSGALIVLVRINIIELGGQLKVRSQKKKKNKSELKVQTSSKKNGEGGGGRLQVAG